MYRTHPTRIAAGLGFIALVFLAGGSTSARADCFGTGWIGAVQAAAAIQAVDIEVRRITAYNAGHGEERFYAEFAIDDEHACLANGRTGTCVKVTPDGMGTSESCSDSVRTSWGGLFKIDFGGLGERIFGLPEMTVQVKVRYGRGGGAWTAWSPEFTDVVPLVFHYSENNGGLPE